MQPDFMKMAQQSQQQKQAGPQEQFTAEELEQVSFSDEDYEASGLAPGKSPEAMKTRLLQMLQRSGVIDDFDAAEKQELVKEVELFVQAFLNKDFKAMQSSYVSKLIEQIGLQSPAEVEEGEEEAPAEQTDFAGMMPPGGGMSGQ